MREWLVYIDNNTRNDFIENYGVVLIENLLTQSFTDLLPHKSSILDDWKIVKKYMLGNDKSTNVQITIIVDSTQK